MTDVDPYCFCIGNIARAIRCQEVSLEPGDEHRLNAFDASVYLAAAFCKRPEDVIVDIVTWEPEQSLGPRSVVP